MSESDLLQTGMKIVGCFVVIGAVFGLAAILYEALGILYVKSHFSPDIQQAAAFFWKWKLSSAVLVLLRLLLGLYLCTGANVLVKMLADKQRL